MFPTLQDVLAVGPGMWTLKAATDDVQYMYHWSKDDWKYEMEVRAGSTIYIVYDQYYRRRAQWTVTDDLYYDF